MISFIDSLVGQVVDAVRRNGLEDDTLIIFTSDHGDYAGQYGINEKWDGSLQDCLLHVPFVMSGPSIPAGKKLKGLSEHVDLPATVLEYLGKEAPEEWVWHGESLLSMLKRMVPGNPPFCGRWTRSRNAGAFLCTPAWDERNGVRTKATQGKQLTYQECPDSMARCKMVRTDEWKLVIRETGGNELFNVAEDPYEMKNLYGDSQYDHIVAELMLQLIQWCLRTDTDRPFLKKFGA